MTEPLTAASEKLLRDLDSGALSPEDYDEISARLWFIEAGAAARAYQPRVQKALLGVIKAIEDGQRTEMRPEQGAEYSLTQTFGNRYVAMLRALLDAPTPDEVAAARPAPPDGLREALDALAVAVIGRFAEAADSIRGGIPDAGREQCSREWAAQQVGYYASSAAGEDIGRLRKVIEDAAALAAPTPDPPAHVWTTDDKHDYEWCRACLLVRQRNGSSDAKPCKGPARVELRATPTPDTRLQALTGPVVEAAMRGGYVAEIDPDIIAARLRAALDTTQEQPKPYRWHDEQTDQWYRLDAAPHTMSNCPDPELCPQLGTVQHDGGIPTPDTLDVEAFLASLPGIRHVSDVTFGELMVPLSAIRKALRAALADLATTREELP